MKKTKPVGEGVTTLFFPSLRMPLSRYLFLNGILKLIILIIVFKRNLCDYMIYKYKRSIIQVA